MNPPTQTGAAPTKGGKRGITSPSRRGGSGRVLTDVLVDLEFVDRAVMDEAIDKAHSAGSAAERVLLTQGAITEDQLGRAVAERFGLDHVALRNYKVDPDAAKLVTPAAVKRYQAVPVSFVSDRTLLVAMADPANVLAVDDIAVMTGYEVRPAVASGKDIEWLLERLEDPEYAAVLLDLDDDEDVEVPGTKPDGAGRGRADVRRPRGQADRLRLRGRGRVGHPARAPDHHRGRRPRRLGHPLRAPRRRHARPLPHRRRAARRRDRPRASVPAVTSRVKIVADLDIAERRVPQDGRISMELEGKHIDLRVATLPAAFGENIVMRILDSSKALIAMETLGMLPQALERFSKAIGQSHGAVLVTGPTGSGKSTSLYAALNMLNTIETNIITIEDPVEYQLDGITQVQVNPRAGLTFSSGLRSMMRADPDIIMVGEIRDRETAQIAIEAALTGHLVLSTLHTNDAPGAISRLIEMGIEPFLVGSAVDCVVAQRLARLLCPECKRRTTLTSDVMRANGFNVGLDLEAYEPVGCARCGGSGYKGRVGLYEVMWVSETIRGLAVAKEPSENIAHAAVHEGMMRLREDGLEKVRRGLTSIAEIARVAGTR